MKAKRITILIEIFIFLICIALTYYYTFASDYSVQMNSLLCNLFIGLSTGGMVAFLIEIPSYFSMKKQNIMILNVNLRYIYIYLMKLQALIKEMQFNSTGNYINLFWEWHFSRTIPLVFPILSVDSNLYLCGSKQKEIQRLQNELSEFVTNTDIMVAPFTVKINTIKISAIENGITVQIINANIEPELTVFLSTINTYIKTIDDVMKNVCDKKNLNNWNLQNAAIKETLIKSNVDMQKREK